jgi:hypothetical protein
MDRYVITLEPEVGDRWIRALGGEPLPPVAAGTSRLLTQPLDQAALHGLLRCIRDAGLGLTAISRITLPTKGPAR